MTHPFWSQRSLFHRGSVLAAHQDSASSPDIRASHGQPMEYRNNFGVPGNNVVEETALDEHASASSDQIKLTNRHQNMVWTTYVLVIHIPFHSSEMNEEFVIEAEHFNKEGNKIKTELIEVVKEIDNTVDTVTKLGVLETLVDTRQAVIYLLEYGVGESFWQDGYGLDHEIDISCLRIGSIQWHMFKPFGSAPEILGSFIRVCFPKYSSSLLSRGMESPFLAIQIDQLDDDHSIHASNHHPLVYDVLELEASASIFRNPGTVLNVNELVTELLCKGYGNPRWRSDIPIPSTTDLQFVVVSPVPPLEWRRVLIPQSSQTQQQLDFLPLVSYSPKSSLSSPASFMTAKSSASFRTAYSAHYSSGISTMMSTINEKQITVESSAGLARLGAEYLRELHQKELLQPLELELNWSGKGQHTTFTTHEAIPLNFLSHLGASATATVDKVLCRRVALARKSMRCTRNSTIAEALREVYHLQKLRHFHIVQLVGTYLHGRTLSILMYPAADCHLGTFMEDTADLLERNLGDSECWHRRVFLGSTLGCLASAIAFVHDNTTKHMDIKPQNILVRKITDDIPGCQQPLFWRVYLSDFGLSRSFALNGQSQTDGPTSRTPRYCAPEVYEHESRGRSSDIFSLGCVFAEIVTTYAGKHPHEFAEFRQNDNNDDSFRLNIAIVQEWLKNLEPSWSNLDTTKALIHVMLREEPEDRPRAAVVAGILHNTSPVINGCYHDPKPEEYVAYTGMDKTIFPPCDVDRLIGKRPVLNPKDSPPCKVVEVGVQMILDSSSRSSSIDASHLFAWGTGPCGYVPKDLSDAWGY